MMEDTSEIGQNIRVVRKHMGLTQEELAKKAGLSTMSIRRYERGERIITDGTLMAIAKALNIEWQKLKGWVCYGYNYDGFEIWGPPESPAELDQMFADNIRVTAGFNASLQARATSASPEKLKEKLNNAFYAMNMVGQKKAVENVQDLAKVPEYQRQAPENAGEAPLTPSKGKDTTQDD